ncbi:hypothetical protein K449DRAFT_197543 [Hypoxylon sp. EC38]|nr:hypothetical protein K449DRAFT_197543 [Hypoxylon sp. EC38]
MSRPRADRPTRPLNSIESNPIIYSSLPVNLISLVISIHSLLWKAYYFLNGQGIAPWTI